MHLSTLANVYEKNLQKFSRVPNKKLDGTKAVFSAASLFFFKY